MSEVLESLLRMGYEARRTHDATSASRYFAAVVAAARQEGGSYLGRALCGMAQVERDAGRREASLQHYLEAADVFRQADDPDRLAHALRHIADVQAESGRADEAERYALEALTIYRNRSDTDRLDLANAIRSLALIRDDAALWTEAREIYQEQDIRAGVEECDRRLRKIEQPSAIAEG